MCPHNMHHGLFSLTWFCLDSHINHDDLFYTTVTFPVCANLSLVVFSLEPLVLNCWWCRGCSFVPLALQILMPFSWLLFIHNYSHSWLFFFLVCRYDHFCIYFVWLSILEPFLFHGQGTIGRWESSNTSIHYKLKKSDTIYCSYDVFSTWNRRVLIIWQYQHFLEIYLTFHHSQNESLLCSIHSFIFFIPTLWSIWFRTCCSF